MKHRWLIVILVAFLLIGCSTGEISPATENKDDVERNTYRGVEYDACYEYHEKGGYTYYLFDFDTNTGWKVRKARGKSWNCSEFTFSYMDGHDNVVTLQIEGSEYIRDFIFLTQNDKTIMKHYPNKSDGLEYKNISITTAIEILRSEIPE